MGSRILKTRNNQITQRYKPGIHEGNDIVGYSYALDYIIAHSDGVVVGVRKDYNKTDKTGHSYGNYVKIKHDNGMYTLYAHLKYGSVSANLNDRVVKGQVVGYMGNTGHSNGAHLHFEVRNTLDVKIDPTSYINADLPCINSKLYTGAYPVLPIRGYYYYDIKRKKVYDRGEEVKKIQRFLNWAIGANLAVDGCYGPNTYNAVKQFQKLVGIKSDGSWGRNTQAKAKTYTK